MSSRGTDPGREGLLTIRPAWRSCGSEEGGRRGRVRDRTGDSGRGERRARRSAGMQAYKIVRVREYIVVGTLHGLRAAPTRGLEQKGLR